MVIKKKKAETATAVSKSKRQPTSAVYGRVNQHDIARMTGLAQKTVSRALRGEGTIREETQRVVLEAAQQLGYRPNRIAQSLLGGKTGLIGYLQISGRGEYSHNLFNGIKETLAKAGYQLIVSPRYDNPEVDDEEIEALLQYNVEGLLVSPRIVVPYEKSIYKRLADEGVPMVMVGSNYGNKTVAQVCSDVYGGVCKLMHHLIDCGHTRIAMIGGLAEQLYSKNERGKAYADVLSDRLPQAQRLDHYYGTMDQGLVRMAIDRFLSEEPKLSAIVCNGDYLALSFQRELEAMGLRVPEDISVIGFGDDLAQPDLLRIPLTTVAADGLAVGHESASLLLDLIEKRKTKRQRLIPTRLLTRASVLDRS